MKKLLVIFLICILISGSFGACSGAIFVGSSNSKPSVPEFTLQFMDNSYNVPPTFQKDPFTGETVMTKEGYHVDNRTVEVKIKNQPFTPYTDSQGNWVILRYDICWKGHFDNYWREYSSNNPWHWIALNNMLVDGSLQYPNAPYTYVLYSVGTWQDPFEFLGDVSDGGQVDFQVKALIGTWTVVKGPPDALWYRPVESVVFSGEDSGWSRTKTVTIGINGNNGAQSQAPPDQSPNSPTDQLGDQSKGVITGFSLMECCLLVVVVVLIVLLGISLFYIRERLTPSFPEEPS